MLDDPKKWNFLAKCFQFLILTKLIFHDFGDPISCFLEFSKSKYLGGVWELFSNYKGQIFVVFSASNINKLLQKLRLLAKFLFPWLLFLAVSGFKKLIFWNFLKVFWKWSSIVFGWFFFEIFVCVNFSLPQDMGCIVEIAAWNCWE